LGKLFCGFDQRRARLRLLSRLAPQASGLLDLPRLRAVTREQFGLVLGNVSELIFEDVRDVSMKSASRLWKVVREL